MAVFKLHKNKNYTIISNFHFREKAMSLKAKGLLSLMFSLPDDWDYSIEGLCAICKENTSAIRNILKELEEFKYLIRTRKQNDKGQFEYEYNIFEKPHDYKLEENEPYIEKPYTDYPYTDNQLQLNTNKQNTNNNNKENILKESLIEEFETLWKIYPKRVDKKKSLEYYISARKKGITYETIKNGLNKYIEYCKNNEWYSPKHCNRWFRDESWNNEYETNIASTNQGTQLKKVGNGAFQL